VGRGPSANGKEASMLGTSLHLTTSQSSP
jgi:hypothetical protein